MSIFNNYQFSSKSCVAFSMLLLSFNSYASNDWVPVGNPGFSSQVNSSPTIVVDSKNIPYVVYQDSYNHIVKFNATKNQWDEVGTPPSPIINDQARNLAVDQQDTLYYAYPDQNTQASVVKFDTGAPQPQWVNEGTPGLAGMSAQNVNVAFDSQNTPYTAYIDNTGGKSAVSVMKKNSDSQNWVNVGAHGFSDDRSSPYALSLVMDNHNTPNTPYVAYTVSVSTGVTNIAVKKFDTGTQQWANVGTNFSEPGSDNPSLAIDNNGIPYIAYRDVNSRKLIVLSFNVSTQSWTKVGPAGFSTGSLINESLALDSQGTPYIAYTYSGNDANLRITVVKYNASTQSWTNVGTTGFLGNNPSLTIGRDGTLYVAYQDAANGNKITVMSYKD